MSKYKYDIMAEYDASFIPSVSNLVDELNSAMRHFGFDEKLMIGGKGAIGTLTSNLPFDDKQLYQIAGMIQEELDKTDLKKIKVTGLVLAS